MARTLNRDDKISHYRIVGPLGSGGMGEVYVAEDTSLERNVALKILPPRLVRSEERVQRFIREAKSASSLNHPNIVTIYEIGQDAVRAEGQAAPSSPLPVHFISMELVGGETLTHKIHEEGEDLRVLVGYLAQAAEGVAKAHAAGIVHRDLKPANIMVSKDGFAKVLDFGLAKLTERSADRDEELTSAPTEDAGTGEGVVLGTVGYMSPEQVQARAADHRSDVFSLGCILYEAATRRRPFVADTDVEVMHQILRETPRAVEEINPGVPAELRRIIRRCIAKNPDQRYQSMKDLAAHLREVAEDWHSLPASGGSGSAIASGAVTAPRARSGFGKAGMAAVALLAVGGIALGLYALMGRGGSRSGAGPLADPPKITTLMSRDDFREAALSGDGRYLAYVSFDGDRSSLMVRQVRTGSDVQILPPQEFPIRGISFSRDGDYLYFLTSEKALPDYSALFQVASLGGTPRKVAFDVDTSVSFSPDGKQLCFRRASPTAGLDSLVVLDLTTGKERTLFSLHQPESIRSPGGAGAPAWSPDGRRIAIPVFTPAGGARTRIAAIDVESGERKDFGSKTWLFVESLVWLPDGASLVLSGFEIGAQRSQIYRLSYPGGEAARITSDLDGYQGVSASSDGRVIAAVRRAGIWNVWVAPLDPGKEAQPITFATGSAASVEFIAPLDDGGIAFTAAQGDRIFVWRMAPDGSGRRQLTTQGVYVVNLVSAKEAGILFTQVEASAVLHVWRMDADGGRLLQITDGSGEQMEGASPDGKTVLFWKLDDLLTVWATSPSGGEPRRFLSPGVYGTIRYSPDGGRLLYSTSEEREGHIYPRQIVIPAGGGQPLASFSLPPGARDLRLGPGGESVTFVDRDAGFNLMRRSIGSEAVEPLTRFDDGRVLAHEWSPDGTRILLQRRVRQQDSLWTLDPRPGKPPAMLTSFRTGRIDQCRWARDSKSVVFTYGTTNQDVVLISDVR